MSRVLLIGFTYVVALYFVMTAPANQPAPTVSADLSLDTPALSFNESDMFSEDYQFDASFIKVRADHMVHIDNTRTDQFIRYFTRRARSRFQRWLHRSNKYIYLVRDILRREGLPVELAILPLTESGYGVYAQSHAGAVGMWQFMPYTGREYGLKQDYWVDERRDFEKATYAAARMLRNMNRYLDDWYLTIAAYNAGYGRIRRGVRRYGSTDFFDLQRHNYLANETKNYVPKFMAMTKLYEEYERYGFDTPESAPLHYEYVRLPFQVNIYAVADALGIDAEDMKELNPELRRPLTPPEVGYRLRVPFGMADTLRAEILERGQGDLMHFTIHFARVGERVSVISETYHVPADRIITLNNLTGGIIREARPIFVPNNRFRVNIDMAFLDEINQNPPKHYAMKHPERAAQIYADWTRGSETAIVKTDTDEPFTHPAIAYLNPDRAALWGLAPDAVHDMLYPNIIDKTVRATGSLWRATAALTPAPAAIAGIDTPSDTRID